VTEANLQPIKLKFEKVYHQYEYRQQVEPDYDAKGIETVRSDEMPAEQMIEEAALKILFRTKDLSR